MSTKDSTLSKSARLRQRCELQRWQLSRHVGDIESRLRTPDKTLGVIRDSLRNFLSQPAVLMAGVAAAWMTKRASLWSLLGRGAVAWGTLRSIYAWLMR